MASLKEHVDRLDDLLRKVEHELEELAEGADAGVPLIENVDLLFTEGHLWLLHSRLHQELLSGQKLFWKIKAADHIDALKVVLIENRNTLRKDTLRAIKVLERRYPQQRDA